MDLGRAEIRGRLDLSSTRSTEPGVDGAPTRQERITLIAGSVRAGAAVVGGDALFNGIQVAGDIRADGLRVGGKLSLGPLREDPEHGAGGVVYASFVGRDLFLPVIRVVGEVSLVAIAVGGRVHLQTADIRGGLFCRCKFGWKALVGGDFFAPGAHIHGAVDLSGAQVCGTVAMEGLDLFGSLFMHDGWKTDEGGVEGMAEAPSRPDLRPRIDGGVSFANAKVVGSAQLHGLQVRKSLRLDGSTFTGGVDLSDACITLDLNLRAATIRGELRCGCTGATEPCIGRSIVGRGARIDSGITFVGGRVGKDLDLAAARISGMVCIGGGCPTPGVDFRPAPAESFRLGGVLDLSDAVVAGSLHALGVLLEGGLKLARAEVRGSVELVNATLWRTVQLTPASAQERLAVSINGVGVRIGGAFRLDGARTAGAVNLQNSRILGGLFCGAAGADCGPTVIGGEVMLDGAEILMLADFRTATVHGEVSLERARVEGKLHCDIGRRLGAPAMQHRLDIRNARIRHLAFGWPEGKKEVALGAVPIQMEGCVFHELSVPSDDYLGMFPSRISDYRQAGFLAVERWLRARGEDDAAESVYSRMRASRRTTLGGLRWLGDLFMGGVRKAALHYVALLLASMVAFGFSTLAFADRGSHVPNKGGAGVASSSIAPSSGSGPAPVKVAGIAAVPAGALHAPDTAWTVTDAALMATRMHLPMLALPGEDQWEPARETMRILPVTRYDVYATVVSVLSYIVIPLIIGGTVTTWLQRRSAGT